MAKEKIVIVEWVDAEFHQLEVDARNIQANLPMSASSVSRSTGTLIYADDQRLVLAGTKHLGGNETYRDLLVIPQGMVMTVHELQAVTKLYPPEEKIQPMSLLPQKPQVDIAPNAEKRLKDALGQPSEERKRKWGFTVARGDAEI